MDGRQIGLASEQSIYTQVPWFTRKPGGIIDGLRTAVDAIREKANHAGGTGKQGYFKGLLSGAGAPGATDRSHRYQCADRAGGLEFGRCRGRDSRQPGSGDRLRYGQVGPDREQNRGDPGEHGHPRVLPASGGGLPRRSGHGASGRHLPGALELRGNGWSHPTDPLSPGQREPTHRHHGPAEFNTCAARGFSFERRRIRRGLPPPACPHRLHDRSPGARRCPRRRVDGGARVSLRALCPLSSQRKSGAASADPGGPCDAHRTFAHRPPECPRRSRRPDHQRRAYGSCGGLHGPGADRYYHRRWFAPCHRAPPSRFFGAIGGRDDDAKSHLHRPGGPLAGRRRSDDGA